MNRSPLRTLLAIACGLLCAVLLGACGGSGSDEKPSARETLQQTLDRSTRGIERGRLNATFRLDPEGLLKLGGPIGVRVSGPFAAPTRGSLARFDLGFLATLAGQRFSGAAISTGRRSFVRLDNRAYAIDDADVAKLRRQARGAAADPRAALRSLGINPVRWITNPRRAGEAQVGGVDTERITGTVNVRQLLADVGALLEKAGGGGTSVLTPEMRNRIAGAVKSSKVDVWTGADDRLLRQIAVAVSFAFDQGEPSPIPGLDGGRISLRVRLDDVNGRPVRIAAPAGARPLPRLTGEGGLSRFVQGIAAGLTGGIGPGQPGAALLRCITQAGGSSVRVVDCVSKLAP
ncbi:MAG TPA: hypothetical protein VM299_04995 [Solirubrobacteraceae bacterium]|nr:hypothetical protein [Solirubrobacteraceae bacterium]